MKKALILAMIVALVVNPFGLRADDSSPERFIRSTDSNTGQVLETRSTLLRHPKTGREIHLVGMVHIGEAGYFKTIRRHIENESRVFYEGVKGSENSRLLTSLMSLYARIAALTDLEVQNRSLVDGKSGWERVDMSERELTGRLGDTSRELTDLIDVSNMLLEVVEPMNDTHHLLPKGIMDGMIRSSLLGRLADPKKDNLLKSFYDVILNERNDLVLERIKTEFENGTTNRIAVVYGAAHMPGLMASLHKDGFRPVMGSDAWFSVCRIEGNRDQGSVTNEKIQKHFQDHLFKALADPRNKKHLLDDLKMLDDMLVGIQSAQDQIVRRLENSSLKEMPAFQEFLKKIRKSATSLDRSKLAPLKAMIEKMPDLEPSTP